MLRLPVAAALAVLAIAAAAMPAEARRLRPAPVCDNLDVFRPCPALTDREWPAARPARALKSSARYVAPRHGRAYGRASQGLGGPSRVVDHPAGCPRRLHCGCGAAVRVFGAPVRALWLAAAWFKFPRAAPAPGMVAVRPHHVMVLEGELRPGVWLVYDANSGRGLTRIHARAIAGWTIVNPHGGRA